MDNKPQENGAPRGPVILILPAFSFVVILSFNWLGGPPQRTALPTLPRNATPEATINDDGPIAEAPAR
jgi:hypothetical protein